LSRKYVPPSTPTPSTMSRMATVAASALPRNLRRSLADQDGAGLAVVAVQRQVSRQATIGPPTGTAPRSLADPRRARRRARGAGPTRATSSGTRGPGCGTNRDQSGRIRANPRSRLVLHGGAGDGRRRNPSVLTSRSCGQGDPTLTRVTLAVPAAQPHTQRSDADEPGRLRRREVPFRARSPPSRRPGKACAYRLHSRFPVVIEPERVRQPDDGSGPVRYDTGHNSSSVRVEERHIGVMQEFGPEDRRPWAFPTGAVAPRW
jgi:hypothetical protein